jgi:methionine aminopeptidase
MACVIPHLFEPSFPKSVCTSVNEVLMHGIPDSRPLEDGDIVNIDVTVYLDGHHGDCSRTFPVGHSVDPDARRLVSANEECVERVIAQLRPGMDLRFIGEFVEYTYLLHEPPRPSFYPAPVDGSLCVAGTTPNERASPLCQTQRAMP